MSAVAPGPPLPPLRALRMQLHAAHQPIAVMHSDCHVCRSEGLSPRSQVLVVAGERQVQALLYQTDDERFPIDQVALSEAAWATLALAEGDPVQVRPGAACSPMARSRWATASARRWRRAMYWLCCAAKPAPRSTCASAPPTSPASCSSSAAPLWHDPSRLRRRSTPWPLDACGMTQPWAGYTGESNTGMPVRYANWRACGCNRTATSPNGPARVTVLPPPDTPALPPSYPVRAASLPAYRVVLEGSAAANRRHKPMIPGGSLD